MLQKFWDYNQAIPQMITV